MYVDDIENIRRQSRVQEELHTAFLRSNGKLRVRLKGNICMVGKYFGCQSTPSSSMKISCQGMMVDECGDHFGVFDVLDVEAVEPVAA